MTDIYLKESELEGEAWKEAIKEELEDCRKKSKKLANLQYYKYSGDEITVELGV